MAAASTTSRDGIRKYFDNGHTVFIDIGKCITYSGGGWWGGYGVFIDLTGNMHDIDAV